MRVEINLKGVRTKKQFHDKVQEALSCPDHYGRNLDALYDVLTDSSEDLELVFAGFEKFVHAMPAYAAAVKKMCEDAATECPNLKISFESM